MTAQKKDLILIFDTNIFLTGVDFNIFKETIYTTSEIIKEINVSIYEEKNRNILNKIQAALEIKKLIIRNPKDKFLKRIIEKSKETGDHKALSSQDIGIIALGLEFKDSKAQEAKLYTNDYSIQNLCKVLDINFSPLYRDGISKQIIFEVYCPFCKLIYKSEYLNELCEKCGSKLKRRPKKIF
ncbi:MAG: NOB1 family endonuclease [Candidatus Hodarchaeota archaeon]